MDCLLFVLSPVEGLLTGFYSLVFLEKQQQQTSYKYLLQFFMWTQILILLEHTHTQWILLGCMASVCLTSEKIDKVTFSKAAVLFLHSCQQYMTIAITLYAH